MRPMKISSGPKGAREGDIPYFAMWDDGSIYSVSRISEDEAVRRYSGPLFGLAFGARREIRFKVGKIC